MKTTLKNFNTNFNTILYPELNYSRPSNKMTFVDFMLNNNLVSEVSIKKLDSFFLSNPDASIQKLNFTLNNLALTYETPLNIDYETVIKTLIFISPNIPWNKMITPDRYKNNMGLSLIFYVYLYNFDNIKNNKNNLLLIIFQLSKLEDKLPYQIIKSLYMKDNHIEYLLPIHLIPVLYSIVNTYYKSLYINTDVLGSFPKDTFQKNCLYFEDTLSFTSHFFDKLKDHYLSVIKDELS